MLLDRQISGFVVEDAADFQQFLQDTQPRWDYVDEDLVRQKSGQETRLIVYLPDNEQGRQTLAGLREDLGGAPRAGYRRGAGPARARGGHHAGGKGLGEQLEGIFQTLPRGGAVCHQALLGRRWRDAGGRQILEIDPASSFGTGTPPHHPAVHPGVGAGGNAGLPPAGHGLRQRHFVHRRPPVGGGGADGGGHR